MREIAASAREHRFGHVSSYWPYRVIFLVIALVLAYVPSGAAKTIQCWNPDEPNSTYYRENVCPPGWNMGRAPSAQRIQAGTYKYPGNDTTSSFEERLIERGVGGLVLGGAFGLLSVLAALGWWFVKGRNRSLAMHGAQPSSKSLEDQCFATALDEIEAGATDRAAMARAMANANGNPDQLKALYIKERVAQLSRLSRRP